MCQIVKVIYLSKKFLGLLLQKEALQLSRKGNGTKSILYKLKNRRNVPQKADRMGQAVGQLGKSLQGVMCRRGSRPLEAFAQDSVLSGFPRTESPF